MHGSLKQLTIRCINILKLSRLDNYFKGTVYIMETETSETKAYERNKSHREKLMCYWGYRFESLCTISKPPADLVSNHSHVDPELVERKDSSSVNTNVQYCSVVKTKLGDIDIIMGAEVDCLHCGIFVCLLKNVTCLDLRRFLDTEPDSSRRQEFYVELKTNRIIQNERQKKNFER